MTAVKKAKLPTPTIEERIVALHEEIDALLEVYFDEEAASHPGVPRTVLAALATARADGTARCKCGSFRHLLGKKT
jgi:hypothetical protein